MLANVTGVELLKSVSLRKRRRKSLSCVVLSSTKREIWHFHVVIVQKRQRNVQKSVRARAKLLFSLRASSPI